MEEKYSIKKGSVEETFLLPLWGRAYETKKANPRLVDKKAVEIIEKIDYDFSVIAKTQEVSQHGWVARSLHTDKMVREFIEKYPKATIVNIGCGMDTTFSRIDNGQILFYELDLPDVITLRKKFYSDSQRHKSIASSFLDTEYFDEIEYSEGVLFLAGGVLMYFSDDELKTFFKKAVDYFKDCDFYFDCLSPKAMEIAKKQVIEKGGMEISIDGGWAIKPVEDIEKWDPRFKVISKVPIYQGAKKGIKLQHKFMLTVSDLLGFCYMVHLKAK